MAARLASSPEGERRLDEWIQAERQRVIDWVGMPPLAARANIPTLTLGPAHTVFASGDFSKRDVYQVELGGDWTGVRALRLEVLPDDRVTRLVALVLVTNRVLLLDLLRIPFSGIAPLVDRQGRRPRSRAAGH